MSSVGGLAALSDCRNSSNVMLSAPTHWSNTALIRSRTRKNGVGRRQLFDFVVLREIVPPTQYLDVRRVFRRTALRVRDDVVEVKLSAGLPKIDFVEPVQARQEVEPITIRNSDEEAHELSYDQIK